MTTFTDQELVQPNMAKTAPEQDKAEAKHEGLTTLNRQRISVFPCRSRLNQSSRKEAS
jgi:hypothetical protein